jgi:hypothetical protein
MPKKLVTDCIINNCHCKEVVLHLAEKFQVCHFLTGEVQISQHIMTHGKSLASDYLTQQTAAATDVCMGSNHLLVIHLLYYARNESRNLLTETF